MDEISIIVCCMTGNPITSLINQWSPRRALAEEIGVDVAAVHKWAANGRIPSGWQGRVVDAAQRRGFAEITADWMLRVHAAEIERGAA